MTRPWPSDEEDSTEREPVTCNRCGASGLEWYDTGVGYRLWDVAKRKLHVCAATRADEFEDLSK